MAYRPGGVLAAKMHLKHVARPPRRATRPGRAVLKPNCSPRSTSTRQNTNSSSSGRVPQLPARHHARRPRRPQPDRLLRPPSTPTLNTDSTAAPKIQRNDRDILNLLSKRAKTLHLGPANYCWFTDPSRALCLKLAGTPTADRPLIGMCDSARCPQATHHQHHRPVWAEHAERTKTFLGQLGPTRTPNSARLQADYDRALRVIADIDSATDQHNRGTAMRISCRSTHPKRKPHPRRHGPAAARRDPTRRQLRCQDPRTRSRGRPHRLLRHPPLRPPTRRIRDPPRRIREAGDPIGPSEGQISRLKDENAKLKDRLAQSNSEIDDLTDFRTTALARLAAQHEEIIRLRSLATTPRVQHHQASRT